MKTIGSKELRSKIEDGDQFSLIMTLDEKAFLAAHIPGSLHFPSIQDALVHLDPDDEIVVYCSDPACVASRRADDALVDQGYTKVRRVAGGLSAWAAAGYELEGTGHL
jgi:rhodanese-related sulfurtransferase